MYGYDLQPNEVLLYDGRAVYRFPQNYSDPDFAGQKASCRLLLTNLSVVLQARVRRMFRQDLFRTIEIPVDEIKMYQGKPAVQLNSQGQLKLMFIGESWLLQFDGFLNAKKFETALTDLVTGTTLVSRSLSKAAEVAAQSAVDLFSSVQKAISARSAGTSSSGRLKMSQQQKSDLKKLRELYESGVLSKYEYEAKCRQVLENQ